MTSTSSRNPQGSLVGPVTARPTDIDALNRVFSDAFTERYRRDGMVGVRVPFLHPTIWRYAIKDADGGAMLWRDERDEIVAFNIAHHSGVEGWMGPLAVRPEWQGGGLGKSVVLAGVDWLRLRGAQVIGLETMPRTMDNIGFYSSMGFAPGRLTITVTLDAATVDAPVTMLGGLSPRRRDDVAAQCRRLTNEQMPGYDFSREIDLTLELGLGDVALLFHGDVVAGFALFHAAPLVEGRAREEMRVLKMVLRDQHDVESMANLLAVAARQSGVRRVAVRVQGEYQDVYRRLVARGARVRWTDLRMTLADSGERLANGGVVLSNWEI